MRLIDTIVIHHSHTSKSLDTMKSIESFSRNHKDRLHQPKSKTGWYIAYHYVVGANGLIVKTREEDEIGYHASNWPVNQKSIGICLLGDFNTEKPDPKQLWALRDLIKNIKGRIFIKEVAGHRHFTNSKNCPGLNMTDEMIQEAIKSTKPNVQR